MSVKLQKRPLLISAGVAAGVALITGIVGFIPLLACVVAPLLCIISIAVPIVTAVWVVKKHGVTKENMTDGLLLGALTGVITGFSSSVVSGILNLIAAMVGASVGSLSLLSQSEELGGAGDALVTSGVAGTAGIVGSLIGIVIGIFVAVIVGAVIGGLSGLIYAAVTEKTAKK